MFYVQSTGTATSSQKVSERNTKPKQTTTASPLSHHSSSFKSVLKARNTSINKSCSTLSTATTSSLGQLTRPDYLTMPFAVLGTFAMVHLDQRDTTLHSSSDSIFGLDWQWSTDRYGCQATETCIIGEDSSMRKRVLVSLCGSVIYAWDLQAEVTAGRWRESLSTRL